MMIKTFPITIKQNSSVGLNKENQLEINRKLKIKDASVGQGAIWNTAKIFEKKKYYLDFWVKKLIKAKL